MADALSMPELIDEASWVFASREHTPRKDYWWVSQLDLFETASEAALAELAGDFGSFASKVDAQRETAFAPIAAKLREIFEPLDDATRAARWSAEKDAHVQPPSRRELEAVAKACHVSVPDEARLDRARRLRTAATLARLGGKPRPHERNDALEAAIASAPDDDAGYLVYGDWFQERGDALGELVAIMGARAIAGRVERFIAERGVELLGPLALVPAAELTLEWHLGFVRHARFAASDASSVEAAMLAAERLGLLLDAPPGRFLRRLTLATLPASAARELFADPRLALVRELALTSTSIPLDVVLASPLVARLRVLDLSAAPLDAARTAELVAGASRLAHLEALEVWPESDAGLALLRAALPRASAAQREKTAATAHTNAVAAATQLREMLATHGAALGPAGDFLELMMEAAGAPAPGAPARDVAAIAEGMVAAFVRMAQANQIPAGPDVPPEVAALVQIAQAGAPAPEAPPEEEPPPPDPLAPRPFAVDVGRAMADIDLARERRLKGLKRD